MKIDRISSVILFLVGAVVAREGSMLPYMKETTPGAGFLPLWLGGGLMLLSVLLFVTTRAKNKPLLSSREGFRKAVLVVTATLIYALAIDYISMLASMAIYIGFLLLYVEKKSWRETLAVSGSVTISCFLLFQFWLGIQLPRGLLLNMFF